jgi:hypothetical protein
MEFAHGRARVVTKAQSLDVAQALTTAGFETRAMTG